MPEVHGVLLKVCERLHLSASLVCAYVYASPEIQAECFAADMDRCILRVTSSMIELMSLEELCFVLGHEIGHYLFRHSGDEAIGQVESPEAAISQRAKEISADRVGLLASPSLEVAIRAIMKSAAGLGSEFLRFDVGSFLEQLKYLEGQDLGATHPSLLVRCRAIVWCSLSREYHEFIGSTATGRNLRRVDQRIEEDLGQYVNGPAQQAIEDAREEVLLWLMACAVVSKGGMYKSDRKMMEAALGVGTTAKIANLLGDQTAAEAKHLVQERLRMALENYRATAPQEARRRISETIDQVVSDTECPDLPRIVRELGWSGGW